MPMPKGYKSKNGYATKNALGGKTYHEISDEMKTKDFPHFALIFFISSKIFAD